MFIRLYSIVYLRLLLNSVIVVVALYIVDLSCAIPYGGHLCFNNGLQPGLFGSEFAGHYSWYLK